ncbi:MAG: hypothetical protein SFZ23_02470 [Planctomycetota bacterium]|nr:hypothetical protein [Planctomycetota bacterium]
MVTSKPTTDRVALSAVPGSNGAEGSGSAGAGDSATSTPSPEVVRSEGRETRQEVQLKPGESALVEAKPATRSEADIAKARRRALRADRLARQISAKRVVGAAIMGAVMTAIWLIIFTLGLSVPSEPFRQTLLQLGSTNALPALSEVVASAFVVLMVYTPTNLLMLCVASALIGCLGRTATSVDDISAALLKRFKMHGVETESSRGSKFTMADAPSAASVTSPGWLLAPAVSAVTWGFFIYLVVISGIVVVTGEPFQDTSPDQYLRLAGSTSILAFVVGWRPQILTALVTRIGDSRLGEPREGREKKDTE